MSFQDKFEFALSCLCALKPYHGEETNMVSLQLSKDNEKVCPSLFQVWLNDDGDFVAQLLQEDTHEILYKNTIGKEKTAKILGKVSECKSLVVLFGPYEIMKYEF